MTMKKMYKVLCPLERNGHTWWTAVGVGFTNKDDSINLHLDLVPTSGPFKLQIREYTEEDQRRSAERRARVGTQATGHHPDPGASFASKEPYPSTLASAPF
jgi:hypothetical protein